MAATRRCTLLGFLSLLHLGCATSGQAWLNTPIESQTTQADSEIYVAAHAARPRLRQTITLGESYVPDTERPAAAAAASNATSVHVNVATYVPVTVNNYAGYPAGYDAAAPVAPTVRSAPVQAGQDFPSPPSYGPAFPYSSSPASPWAR